MGKKEQMNREEEELKKPKSWRDSTKCRQIRRISTDYSLVMVSTRQAMRARDITLVFTNLDH